MTDKENIYRAYEYCKSYLKLCNRKQIDALWEYINLKHRYPFTWSKSAGIVGILAYWEVLAKNDDKHYSDTLIWDDFIGYWTFILGMLMVQDEYNKYNPNWKSPLKK